MLQGQVGIYADTRAQARGVGHNGFFNNRAKNMAATSWDFDWVWIVCLALVLAGVVRWLMRNNAARFNQAHSVRQVDKSLIFMFIFGLGMMVLATFGIGKSPEFIAHQVESGGTVSGVSAVMPAAASN